MINVYQTMELVSYFLLATVNYELQVSSHRHPSVWLFQKEAKKPSKLMCPASPNRNLSQGPSKVASGIILVWQSQSCCF